jgi:hypothetical protein
MPDVIVTAMHIGQAVPEVLLVVALLDVVDLQPDSGHVDGLDMRGESPVSVVDVLADVASTCDDILAVLARLGEILLPPSSDNSVDSSL